MSSRTPFHTAEEVTLRPISKGRLAFEGAVAVSLATMTPSTYRRAVAPSYVPVTRCQPAATTPPSAHPYCDPQVPVLPVPFFTMNWYFVPVVSTPKYSPVAWFVSAIAAKEACVVGDGLHRASS